MGVSSRLVKQTDLFNLASFREHDMSLTETTCDDECFADYVVIDQSSTSTNESVTLGRLLFKLSQKKKKSNTRARIRYRISNRFDLRNLNYATEETSERDDPELEENPRIEEINEE